MALYSSWTHGNALEVEHPELLSQFGYRGWGTDMMIPASSRSLKNPDCWFHIPIPTPVVVADIRLQLIRVFLLYLAEPEDFCGIARLHVWDGSSQIQEFLPDPKVGSLSGDHLGKLDSKNTFKLTKRHSLKSGIGVSFQFEPAIGIDSPVEDSRLLVAAAGADFEPLTVYRRTVAEGRT